METLALERLREVVAKRQWPYRVGGPSATEPASFAGLALCAHGLASEAMSVANWLGKIQTASGSVGVTAEEEKPAWPTSLALLTWNAVEKAGIADFALQTQLAIDWILRTKGKRLERRRQIGHDTTILGWSWAENTHSWLEPTCLCVLALQAAGKSDHERAIDGVSMIVDRLHATGGCNYGNTVVLGQSTLPHVQPTGLAMLAIADAEISDTRVERSLEYLERSIDDDTATASLCFALMGLTAHQRRPVNATALVEQAMQRDAARDNLSCYKLALLALAGIEDLSWLPGSRNSPNPVAVRN
ncbi:MAG: hypothetical protein AAGD11_05755 [Planctomycetota bacterium]